MKEHNCCDICAKTCTCDENTCSAEPSHAEQKIKDILLHGLATAEWRVVTVEDSNVSELKESLQEYRETLLTDSSDHLYTSQDLAGKVTIMNKHFWRKIALGFN